MHDARQKLYCLPTDGSRRSVFPFSGKRLLSLLVCLALLLAISPAPVRADTASRFSCGHVCADGGDCGYSSGFEGSPCDHVHSDACGYCQGMPCAYTHVHSETCGYNAETGAPCLDAHVCAPETCGYVPASSCAHVCGDGACGYVAPRAPAPCRHVCQISSFDKHSPVLPLDVRAATLGDTAGDVAKTLPKTLKGRVSCASGPVEIPVKWVSGDFTAGVPGEYVFTVRLDRDVCVYTPPDDPQTVHIDESVVSPWCDLPFIIVSVAPAAQDGESLPPEPAIDDVPVLTDAEPALTNDQPAPAETVEPVPAETVEPVPDDTNEPAPADDTPVSDLPADGT